MNDLEIIKDVIKNTGVVVKRHNFTYVDKLLPQFAESPAIVLICKKIIPSTSAVRQEIPDVRDEPLEATNHDVTGSPLRHDFGEETFDVTIVDQKRNWSRDEENHIPLEQFQASKILNLCLERLGKKWSMPLFVLCNGSDRERTVLLGTFVEEGWFSTTKVCIKGLLGSSKAHNCGSLLEEHLKMSAMSKREVNVEISSTYEFCGISKAAMDWSDKERINYEGYLSLELSWNTLTFLPPARTTSNYLIAQIAAGWRSSPLRDLWDQLILLDKYLTILEAYQERNLSSRYSVLPLMFPKNFNNPYVEKPENLSEKLNQLLDDVDFENCDDQRNHSKRLFENDADFDENALLRNYLNRLSARQNLDFTDKLWRLIVGSSDYKQMTDHLHKIFKDICNHHCKPQIDETQPTRIANLINDLNFKNAAMPSLAGSFPLELVIDMGVEKMSRDYKYLLFSANLADVHDIRQKLLNISTEEFSTDKYRKLLLTMAQIHICLEFLLLLQNNVDCSLEVSYSFFDYAMKLYTSSNSPVKSFADLIDNTIYTLKAPGSNAVIKEVSKTSPSMWRATLSSACRAKKLSTTTHYSLSPLFPPNIYTPDDTIEGAEQFHVTSVVSSSYKIH